MGFFKISSFKFISLIHRSLVFNSSTHDHAYLGFRVLLMLFLSPPIFAMTYPEIQKIGEIRLATEGNFPPFNVTKGKIPDGFEVELATSLAERMGLKFKWQIIPFENLLIGLNHNRYDLVAASHGVTPERSKAVEFSNPHYCTGGAIFSRDGKSLNETDLHGKVVGVEVGTTYFENVKKIPGIKEVKTFPKDTDSLQNLISNRIHAWVTDRFVGRAAAKAHPGAKITMGQILFEEQVAMAFSKGNQELKGKVNTALAGLLADGTYEKLSMKYFGEDIRCRK